MNRTLVLCAGLLWLVYPTSAGAYTITLDMDASLAGIQSSVAVTSGSTITVTGWLTSTTGTALFDHVGLDLGWSKPGELASLSVVAGSPLAGSLAGVAGPSLDLFTSAVVAPSSSLSLGTLGASGANAFNLGGFGYFDSSATLYGGLGSPFGPPGTAVDVFTVDFVVTGVAGSSVTMDPSGIFVPGIYASLPPLTIGGDALWDSIVTLFTFPGAFTGGTVLVVPEPGAGLLLALGVGLALRRRRPGRSASRGSRLASDPYPRRS